MLEKIKKAQKYLDREKLDGWLLFDFRRSNSLACHFLEIPEKSLLTRRFFYWIPKVGSPLKIISQVENPLNHLPGESQIFRSWSDLAQLLKQLLKKNARVAMEYSPQGAIPEISKVDGGTIDLVKGCGAEVVSSGNLLQEFVAVWDENKMESHRKAAHFLDLTVAKAWNFIEGHLKSKSPITEYDVQQFILNEMTKEQFFTNYPPICAVNENSANPHYAPSETWNKTIAKGDFILIDLWCKEKKPRAVYADITRVGVAANTPTEKQEEIFTIVKEARDAAFFFLKERLEAGKEIFGYEVDQVCRGSIEASGYGDYFVHRTGHNIDEEDHGPGAHIDNLETHDERKLLAETCFSIEPGIYLPGKFGIRLECDIILHDKTFEITGGVQEELKTLLF